MTSKITTPPVGLARYIKQPAIGSSEFLDGRQIDAETSMIFHHNATLLGERSCRLIGQDAPGLLTGHSGGSKGNSPYSGLPTLDLPGSFRSDNLDRIPWTFNDSACFGPVPAAAVSLSVSPPGYVLRPVRITVKYSTSGMTAGKHLYLEAALTTSAEPPRTGVSVITSDHTDITSATIATWDTTLTPLYPVRPSDSWLSRPNSNLRFGTPVVPLHVWVGWDTDDVEGSVYLYSVSAFEVYS